MDITPTNQRQAYSPTTTPWTNHLQAYSATPTPLTNHLQAYSTRQLVGLMEEMFSKYPGLEQVSWGLMVLFVICFLKCYKLLLSNE